ncbi:ABC transporter ATP-binding protein [Ideonella azotifigens]|uniref:Sn-glycerol-3-phosphate ABC transporter ATP-binding protein UgpC n=1 Tax=Ideonella azotifigens TaxID=513160 RepID=A0ABP3VNE0_9BURK|nr:ABC transporter ATP-binding protein [Ideonella azotifigens]MCD2343758.1 ABC transporter ATP-binding protein [Ideonella azotifigens]
MSSVTIEDLDIRLSGVDIIRQLNLEVGTGEFLVLLGPSGCGKSTLLHSIAGLIDVHDGRMAIGGRDVTWADPKDRGIGMVFQSYALYPTMSVEKNLSFGPRIAGVPKAEITKRVKRAASMLQLTELLHRKPAQLSGGQRQRVAIGRALVREASVFLFDEPLSNLDAKLRGELRRELKALHQELGATMIYVTHDQVEAMTLASRIAVMKSGVIQQIDTPAAVYAKPANMFVAGFLGAPSMNFVTGQLQRNGDARRFVSPTLQVDVSAYPFVQPPAVGQPVVLGVRPQHVTLTPAEATGTAGRAQVSMVEPMGSHQIIWLDAQGLSLAADLQAEMTQVVDGHVGFTLDAAHISLFDPGTQARL